jgi:deoxycytidylate deaminase
MHAAADINQRRPEGPPRSLEKQAFILHQLKHPDEVLLLRRVYGDAFHLIGIYTPQKVRLEYLNVRREIAEESANSLIDRDAGEEISFGQQVTKTYHLADFFIEATGIDEESESAIRDQVRRYFDLLFGRKIITPTRDEYGMYLAHSAALRSGDLSRQVGAAILSRSGEVLGLGANEVPAAGGGQYWASDDADRDLERGYDANERMKLECLQEVLEALVPNWKAISPEERGKTLERASTSLKNTRLMNLTEFGRAVHAEMEAILSAGRVGTSVRRAVLYSTTFPCHNCAKHIVGSGIEHVFYIEPYAKSLADRLHGDAIAFQLAEEGESQGKVQFSSFRGVSPRRFERMFSTVEPDGGRVKRKEKGGNVTNEAIGLRLASSPLNHIDREAAVAQFLKDEMDALSELKRGGADDQSDFEER